MNFFVPFTPKDTSTSKSAPPGFTETTVPMPYLGARTLSPKDFKLDYGVGDKVRAPKYGIGTVVSVNPGGADFEVEVSFGAKGTKKFMARLSKLIKVSE